MTFSVITMPASTSTPMQWRMPASDMMFDEMPKWFIKRTPSGWRAGSGQHTMKMLAEMKQEK